MVDEQQQLSMSPQLVGPTDLDIFTTQDIAKMLQFVFPFQDNLAKGVNAFILNWNIWDLI